MTNIAKRNRLLQKQFYKKTSCLFNMIIKKEHNMNIQYLIIILILITAIGYATWRIYKSIKQNLACKDYHCAGCGLYEKCKKKSKK